MTAARATITSLFTVFLSFTGCRHLPEPPASGSSAYRVVEPPPLPPPSSGAAVTEPTNRAQYREAVILGDAALPVYPPRALKARAGAAQVGVRVTVDTGGRITNIRPSLMAISIIPAGFADDFHAAVELALRQWKFQPARAEYLETFTEHGFTGLRVTRTETLEADYDLAFTFTAAGKVETGASR